MIVFYTFSEANPLNSSVVYSGKNKSNYMILSERCRGLKTPNDFNILAYSVIARFPFKAETGLFANYIFLL